MKDHVPPDTASYPTSNAFSKIHHLALADTYDDIDLHLLLWVFLFLHHVDERVACRIIRLACHRHSLCPTLNGLVVKIYKFVHRRPRIFQREDFPT